MTAPSSNRGKKYEDFFCLTPIGVRVGYGSPNRSSTAVLKVRGQIIEEIGISDKPLTTTHKAQLNFLKSSIAERLLRPALRRPADHFRTQPRHSRDRSWWPHSAETGCLVRGVGHRRDCRWFVEAGVSFDWGVLRFRQLRTVVVTVGC
jgi:hypothetical protein